MTIYELSQEAQQKALNWYNTEWCPYDTDGTIEDIAINELMFDEEGNFIEN